MLRTMNNNSINDTTVENQALVLEIIGPAGSGKTTLLKALSRRHKKIQQEYSKADAPTSDCKGCHVPLNDLDGEQARILEKTKNIDKTLLNVLKTINKKAFY